MTTLQIITDLNKQTLEELQTNDFVKAVGSSTLALTCFKPCLDMTITERGLIECVDHCMLRATRTNQASSSSENNSTADGNDVFIYQRGIPIPSDATDLTMVTPILIFNAALALHLLAKKQEKEEKEDAATNKDAATSTTAGDASIKKAKQLYQLAHHSTIVDWNVNVLFDFVIVNNIAVIDQKLGNLIESKACLAYLVARYLIFMHNNNDENDDDGRLEHLEGFWRNKQEKEE